MIQPLQGRLRLTDPKRKTLGEIGRRLGRKALADVANIVRPETILGWYRKLLAKKFDGSKARASPGRPQISQELQALILRMARKTQAGAMTALRVHSKTWGTQCQTKASVIFSNAKTFPNPRSARPRRHGQNSFKATAQCWLRLTSSARRF